MEVTRKWLRLLMLLQVLKTLSMKDTHPAKSQQKLMEKRLRSRLQSPMPQNLTTLSTGRILLKKKKLKKRNQNALFPARKKTRDRKSVV